MCCICLVWLNIKFLVGRNIMIVRYSCVLFVEECVPNWLILWPYSWAPFTRQSLNHKLLLWVMYIEVLPYCGTSLLNLTFLWRHYNFGNKMIIKVLIFSWQCLYFVNLKLSVKACVTLFCWHAWRHFFLDDDRIKSEDVSPAFDQ